MFSVYKIYKRHLNEVEKKWKLSCVIFAANSHTSNWMIMSSQHSSCQNEGMMGNEKKEKNVETRKQHLETLKIYVDRDVCTSRWRLKVGNALNRYDVFWCDSDYPFVSVIWVSRVSFVTKKLRIRTQAFLNHKTDIIHAWSTQDHCIDLPAPRKKFYLYSAVENMKT